MPIHEAGCKWEEADICGIEVQGVYDGVLFWKCLKCDWAWSRNFRGRPKLQDISIEHAAKYNSQRVARGGDAA